MLFNTNGSISHQHDEPTKESTALIMEAALSEVLSPEELEAFLESHTEVTNALHDEVLLEKSIVRLDKQAKLTRAQKVAVFTIAKEKNDPLFKKLLTVWRMERFLESQLLKKYGNEGMRRAKKAMQTGSQSKSALIKKVANNVNKQLNSVKTK
jgi:hypothetical protein